MNWRLEVAADDASHGRSATQCHTPRRLVPGAAQVGRDSLKRQPFKLEDVVTVDGRPRKTGVGCHASWPTVAHRRGSAAGTQRVSSTSMPPSASAGISGPGANDSCATRGPRSPSNSCGFETGPLRPLSWRGRRRDRGRGGTSSGAYSTSLRASCPTVRALLVLSPREVLTALARLIPHHACAGTATLGSWRQRRARSRRPGGKAPPVMTRPDTRTDCGPVPVGAADRPDLRGVPAELSLTAAPRCGSSPSSRTLSRSSASFATPGFPTRAPADCRPHPAPDRAGSARRAEPRVTSQKTDAQPLHPRQLD